MEFEDNVIYHSRQVSSAASSNDPYSSSQLVKATNSQEAERVEGDKGLTQEGKNPEQVRR
jgi:hypothetical protein